MIGHEQPKCDVPAELLVIVLNGGEELGRDCGSAKLIDAAGLTTERDEIGGVGYPVRWRVVEPATSGEGHGERVETALRAVRDWMRWAYGVKICALGRAGADASERRPYHWHSESIYAADPSRTQLSSCA